MVAVLLPLLLANTPVPRYGQCPTHTNTQGGSCFPNPGYTVYWNNGGQCGVGWTSSKGYYFRSVR
jgi:hypothetical protein